MKKETLKSRKCRAPYRINLRRNTPRHIIIKLTKVKDKEKILKATREKQQITYKGIPVRLSAELSAETLQSRRGWHDILKVMKGKNLQPRILYPARLSLRSDREIKSFTDNQKLREFSTTKPALQQMLKELLSAKKKRPQLETRKLQTGKLTGKKQTYSKGRKSSTR